MQCNVTSLWCQPTSHYEYIPGQWPLYTSVESSTKPEVHKVLQRSKKEDQAKTTGNMDRIFGQELKTRGVVPEICTPTDKHTDKQTNKHAHYNTPLSFTRGTVKNPIQYAIQVHNFISAVQ